VQEVVIREEKETGEGQSFGVQVFVQAFLNAIYHVVALLQVFEKASLKTGI
jgi:hypothetical protein